MDLGLRGKRALVTGSTAGIGWAAARALAAEGADVTVNGRTEPRVRAAVELLRQEVPAARVNGVAADLSTAAGCDALLARLADVDILVNNMGIFEPQPFRCDHRCRLAPLLRDQRAERNSSRTSLRRRHAGPRLGAHRLRLQ